MKRLIERGAKKERYDRHRERHWDRRDESRQLKLPFWEDE
jgi:hypothetical protein